MESRIEAAAAAVRSAEAAMASWLEQDPAASRRNEAAYVLQQLRIALGELGAVDGHAAAVHTAGPGATGATGSGHPADDGGQPLPDRATDGRPPIDA